MSLINIEHLKYKYPNTDQLVLNDISLTIEKGEFIGIIGRNGAGKSTLSQAIIGLVPQFYKGAYGGKVTVDGRLADKVPVNEMCEKVGLIFQNPFNQLSGAKDTVFGEVAFGLQNLGIESEEMKKRVEHTLKQLDIWQYRDRNPFDLSGGQMQRVAIASVLVMQPDVLILDEPTSQLDPQGTEEVFKVVEQLSQTGITIIMIEQKFEKMAKYCDKLILMNDGQIVDFDTPEKIFSRDDLEELGVEATSFTRICRELGWTTDEGLYPATLEATLRIFEKHSQQNKVVDKSTLLAKVGGKVKIRSEKAEKIYDVNNLTFEYIKGVTIFKNLDLMLDNRSTAIIGQNGAGKTTLVRLLKGLLKPIDGTILFHGEDISGKTVASLASSVGYVFQNPDDQIFKYNVLEEVMFGPLQIGMSNDKALAEARKALELLGLADKEKENPYDLELNERKMVAIASVIAMDTDVIILDEPTIAQDFEGKRLIGNVINELEEKGKLVIAILHDMDFVAKNFERVIVMAHGKVLCDTNVINAFSNDEILEHAKLQKPYLMQLIDKL